MNTKKNKLTFTSRSLRAIAFVWICFPLTYLIFAHLFYSVSFSNLFKLILGPSYWIASFFAILSGIGVLRIKWYGWYSFLFSNFLVSYLNLVVLAYYSELDAQLKFLFFAVTSVVQMLLILVVAREIRVPYFFPRIRWWESDPRYKLSVQTTLIKQEGASVSCEILDLSLGGCFVKTLSPFRLDEVINIGFSLFNEKVNCNGRVVWKTESTVTHPKGIGIRFEEVNRETSNALKRVTQSLKKMNRDMNQKAKEVKWQAYSQRDDIKHLLGNDENEVPKKKKN